MSKRNRLLTRYWFKTIGFAGIGVTAFSLDDAKVLIREADVFIFEGFINDLDKLEVVENVDVRALDQNHVIPNMGPPNFRGIWFPNLL